MKGMKIFFFVPFLGLTPVLTSQSNSHTLFPQTKVCMI